MHRVQTVVTGVVGGPYYLVGYFDAAGSNAQNACAAWHLFITGGGTGTATGFPDGSRVETQPEVLQINPVDGAVVGLEDADGLVSIGANTSDQLPTQNQFLVRWRTGEYINRRENRGRTNLPCPFEEALTNEGRVAPAIQTALQARANTLVNNIAVRHVVWSKKNGGWSETVSASVWDQFSVLRSRRD